MSTELIPALTARENRIVRGMIEGKSDRQAIIDAGFSTHLANHPPWLITPEMRELVVVAQQELTKRSFDLGLITAGEIHEYLTDSIRARMSDIRNDDHSFKPRSEWPEIWDRLEEGGEVEVEYASARSHDGETKDKAGGWDTIGKVMKVKFKFPSKVKLLELAMRHKAVNAMVEQRGADVNVLVVTAETARKVASAKKRLAKVIEVKPE